MTAPAVLEREDTRTQPKAGDPGRRSHIVFPPPDAKDETPQAYVLRARIEGFAITALCGHTWIPSADPAKYPLCEPCKDIYQSGGDPADRAELPDA
jgi:hypothetical protein